MTVQRVERYSIEKSPDGTILRMRQGRRGLGVALVSLAVLFVSWWIGQFGSDAFYWFWSGFFRCSS